MNETDIQQVLQDAAEAAVEGRLDDHRRVLLYRLALSVAASEFHRIESTSGGSVNPGVLVLLQQIAILCDEDVKPSQLVGSIESLLDNAEDEEDSR